MPYFSIENSVNTTDGLQNVRSIHPYVVIVPRGVAGHSVEMREAACSPQADEGLMLAVKALGMTVADLLAQPELWGGKHEISLSKGSRRRNGCPP